MSVDFATISAHERYKLLCATVVPRPIALVTTIDENGVANAAPFSFFNVFSETPALVVLGLQHRPGNSPKDTTRNIAATGFFCVNLVDEALAEAMNVCAVDFPHGESEIDAAGLTLRPGESTPVPFIAEAPFALECRREVALAFGAGRELMVGEVLRLHARATGTTSASNSSSQPHRSRSRPVSSSVHPVDEKLPMVRLVPLALQHVLVMYAGAVAVPLIVGRALKLSPQDVAFLISADLFACGIATLVQTYGFPSTGIRLPVMMGVTFASLGPMLSMAAAPEVGLLGIFGSVIAAGIFGIIVAPFISRLLPLFPAVVTGTIILVIGISLMRVGINWAGGGQPTITRVVDGVPGAFPNPNYAGVQGLMIATFVLLVILALLKWTEGFVRNVAVLLGIVAGCVLAAPLGLMHFDKVGQASWVDIVLPFHFGMPQFHLIPIVTMCVVMVVVMIESLGMFLALGEITGKEVTRDDLTKGLRADGVGTLVGGIFNTFPYTSFSQNVGLVGVTGVRSRWVTVVGGVIMVILGLLPKMAALVEAVPQVVLGGAGLVMFGMVAATGARILSGVDFRNRPNNLFVVAIAVGFGMIPLVSPTFFKNLPHDLHPLLESGILLSAIVAVVLNYFFNGIMSAEEAAAEAAAAAATAEHA